MSEADKISTHPHGRESLSLEQLLIACLANPDSLIPVHQKGLGQVAWAMSTKFLEQRCVIELKQLDLFRMCADYWNATPGAQRDAFQKKWTAESKGVAAYITEAVALAAKQSTPALPPPAHGR